eukprot:1172100-Prorocentrum_minimum.AAC.2
MSWTRDLELAASDCLELPPARVVPLADGRLHAANAASVETLVAAALLDVSATVQGFNRATERGRRPSVPSDSQAFGATATALSGT